MERQTQLQEHPVTLLVAKDNRAWAGYQTPTSSAELEWVLHSSDVVVTLRWGEFSPSNFCSQKATQTAHEKRKTWEFSLLQNRGEERALCIRQIFQSLLANHELTHPKYTLEKNPNLNNIKTPPFHLPPQVKAVTVKCRIKRVPVVKHYTWKHKSLAQTRKQKEAIYNDNRVGEKDNLKEPLNKDIKADIIISKHISNKEHENAI